jgi:hypothetical protein
MKLSMIIVILSFFLIYSCQGDASKNDASASMEKASDIITTLDRTLEDGRTVKIKSYSLEKGEADDSVVQKGVSSILDKMTDLYITQIKMNSTTPLTGTCLYTFRIEPNGMFRMIQEGRRTVVEEDFAPLKESFLVSAMAHEFKFPVTGSQLVVKLEFEFK